MLNKIGEADRKMAEIDAAREAASLIGFDPIGEKAEPLISAQA